MGYSLLPYQTLVFYDSPELFLAKDIVGAHYLCLRIKPQGDDFGFLATQLSSDRIAALIAGEVDLREVFLKPEIESWWAVSYNSDVDRYVCNRRIEKVTDDLLPSPGFYIDFGDAFDEVLMSESAQYHNTVIHLTLKDSEDQPSIDLIALAEIAKGFQTTLKNLGKKLKALKKIEKELITPSAFNLKAVAVSSGSFRLHLRSEGAVDLLSKNVLDHVLHRFDDMVIKDSTNEDVINAVRPYSGHSVSAYKGLLGKLVKYGVSLNYSWSSPGEERIFKKEIGISYAKHIKEVLETKKDLGVEIVTFVGPLSNIGDDAWAVNNINDGKVYSGKTSTHKQLTGVSYNSTHYELVCEEHTEENDVSGKESTTYTLQTFRPIDPDVS